MPTVPPYDFPLPVAPRPAPKKSRWWIWLLVVTVPMAGLCGLGGLGLLFSTSTERLEPTDADRRLLVTIEDLAPLADGLDHDPALATLEKDRLIDGAIELDYTYDDTQDLDAPYVSCTASREVDLASATGAYVGTKIGGEAGARILAAGKALTDRDDLLKWGDQSRFALLMNDGQAEGAFFVARSGRYTYALTISGVALRDPSALAELLASKLEALTELGR